MLTDSTLDDTLFAEVDRKSVEKISETHYSQLNKLFPDEGRSRAKAFGQFFTPSYVSAPMFERIVELMGEWHPDTLSIIDPFCGDGGLIVDFLAALSKKSWSKKVKLQISIWEIDKSLLSLAKNNILGAILEFSLKCNIVSKNIDTFSEALKQKEKFDICVTNPPWSSTKSLKKNFFEEESEYLHYQKTCNNYAQMLDKVYKSVNDKDHSRIVDTNMSRFGLDACISLLKKGGLCGIVMPESFLSDSSSRNLRKEVFKQNQIHRIDYFSASLKPFKGADQGCITCVIKKNNGQVLTQLYSHYEEGKIIPAQLKSYMLNDVESKGESIPLGYSTAQIDVLFNMDKMRRIESLKDIKIRKEKDETRITSILKDKGDFLFLKGYMIDCFSVHYEHLFLSRKNFKKIPESVFMTKIVWRDVSRISQKKRVKATIVPENCVAGNSLGVLYSKNRTVDLYVLLAIINSYVFEFYVNSKLTNNHISIEAIKKAAIPDITKEDSIWISSAVAKILHDQKKLTEYIYMLNARIGYCYGLTLEEYLLILDKFSFSLDEKEYYTQAAKQEWRKC